MLISLYDYSNKKEGSCAIEFKRIKGSPTEYSKQVKEISEKFLSILDQQKKEEDKERKEEETKSDE